MAQTYVHCQVIWGRDSGLEVVEAEVLAWWKTHLLEDAAS
jgi:hypothetical protein